MRETVARKLAMAGLMHDGSGRRARGSAGPPSVMALGDNEAPGRRLGTLGRAAGGFGSQGLPLLPPVGCAFGLGLAGRRKGQFLLQQVPLPRTSSRLSGAARQNQCPGLAERRGGEGIGEGGGRRVDARASPLLVAVAIQVGRVIVAAAAAFRSPSTKAGRREGPRRVAFAGKPRLRQPHLVLRRGQPHLRGPPPSAPGPARDLLNVAGRPDGSTSSGRTRRCILLGLLLLPLLALLGRHQLPRNPKGSQAESHQALVVVGLSQCAEDPSLNQVQQPQPPLHVTLHERNQLQSLKSRPEGRREDEAHGEHQAKLLLGQRYPPAPSARYGAHATQQRTVSPLPQCQQTPRRLLPLPLALGLQDRASPGLPRPPARSCGEVSLSKSAQTAQDN